MGNYHSPFKHGKCASRTYNIWKQMRYRCNNPKATGYANYGGRGVKVCARWNEFAKFNADMGDPPSPQHTLDRFPNKNGNYRPGNCRWATPTEQGRNRRDNLMVAGTDGAHVPLVEAVEKLPYPVKYNSVLTRIIRGEAPEEALRPKRRAIPRAIKVQVVDRQKGVCKCGCGQQVAPRNTATHFDHEPALRLRDINADGSDYEPPQHHPDYIDARCIESHKAKTKGTGATTAGTDVGKIKKERRRARTAKAKPKWVSKPMQSRSNFPPKGTRPFRRKP